MEPVYFFGCKSTKKSAYACAVYTLFIKVVAIAVLYIIAFHTEEVEKQINEINGGTVFKVTRNFYLGAIIHCSLYFVKALLLIIALKLESRKLMIPWMIGTIQDACIKLNFMSLFLRDGGTGCVPLMLFVLYGMSCFVAILVYEFLSVLSHYQSLRKKSHKN
ncbi:uncharacterized protein [Centruroides vittatus]|uniref:uncharacterized protein n=1 Tax=Centruroides vittatus TaxID=120091 RepID=UPI00350ED942